MKLTKITAWAILAGGAVLAGATKPPANPADFPLLGTVKCSFSRVYAGTLVVRVGVLTSGKMVEMSTGDALVPMRLGDYRMRVIKDKKQKSYEVDQQYEMLMPDGTTRTFSVTGVGTGICSSAGSS